MEEAEDRFFREEDVDIRATFWEHLQILRSTLLIIIASIAGGIILCFTFYSPLLDWVLSPLQSQQQELKIYDISYQRIVNQSDRSVTFELPKDSFLIQSSVDIAELSPNQFKIPPGSSIEYSTEKKSSSVYLFSPLEGMSVTLKICFWGGLAITSPIWLFFIIQYMMPALRKNERRLFIPLIGLSVIFFLMGTSFAYYITIPLANGMLHQFNQEIGVNLWSLSYYFDYTFLLLLANGIAFEIALLLFILVHLGIISPTFMKSKRRHMIFFAFIIGALLTPPDVLTQIMLAIPLICLYELAIIYGNFKNFKNFLGTGLNTHSGVKR